MNLLFLSQSSATRGGYIRNITFKNIQVASAYSAITILQNYGSVNPACTSHNVEVTTMDMISFSDITVDSCTNGATLRGFNSTLPVTNIHMNRVHFRNVTGSSFICKDVSGSASDVTPTPCQQLTVAATLRQIN